ncbi:MAG: DUF1559 domain-containing protein, partial [Pirellulales bacterium]|nr:DUF1559 domain-containing protein [Pirellulales bacterium]
MPIQFTCPFCGTQTNVADQYAGQTGPCAKCGQTITIPGVPVAGAGGYVHGPAAVAKKSSNVWIVAVILVAVLGVVVVCGGIMAALLLPAVQAAREAARRAVCTNNMKQITLALQNYESQYCQFPPAYVADKDGKPLYSWRVLILPYLDHDYLYQQFNLDEPWDSPANRAVSQATISLFQCPSDSTNQQGSNKTNYVMVVGPGCISDGPTGKRMRDIPDGLSKTIILAEVANADIHWAEPRDLDAATMSYKINDPSGQECISSNHP